MNKHKRKQNGITLISLVISIIVMLILAGVSLNAVVGDNGVISRAQNANIISKFSNYKEQLELNLAGEISCAGTNLRKYISSIEDGDLEKFVISKGKLSYIGNSEAEKQACETIAIDTDMAGNTNVQDIIQIVDKVLSLSENQKIPQNDKEVSNEELPGIRLYDKNSINSEKWRLVIDYDEANQEIGRYGSGYYLLKAGVYTINGEEINLNSDYVINYFDNILLGLTDNYVEWTIDSTLAITEGLKINIDPSNVSDGDWGNLTLVGEDIFYDTNEKAISLNRSTDTGSSYMYTSASELAMATGFTFSMYYKLDRLWDPNGEGTHFMPLLYVQKELGMTRNHSYRCHFYSNGKDGIYTRFGANVDYTREFATGVVANEMQQLTVTFIPGDGFYYYLNGVEIDKAEITEEQLDTFISNVDLSTYTCFIGTSVYGSDVNYHYLQGFIYGMQIYNRSFTGEEAKLNYDMQSRYISSFK